MNKKYIAATCAVVLPMCSHVAANDEHHDEETHSFLQISHVTEKEAAENLTLRGLSILGRYDISERLFLRAELEQVKNSDVKEEGVDVVLAYILNPHSSVEYHTAAVLAYSREEEGFETSSSDAFGIEFGFHSSLTDRITLHGEMAWLNETDDDVVEGEIGLYYRLTENIGFNGEYALDENSNEGIEIGIRYSF